MYIDFKKTIWERIHIPPEKSVDFITTLMIFNGPKSLNEILVNDLYYQCEQIKNTEEFLHPYENNCYATVILYDDNGKIIKDNNWGKK